MASVNIVNSSKEPSFPRESGAKGEGGKSIDAVASLAGLRGIRETVLDYLDPPATHRQIMERQDLREKMNAIFLDAVHPMTPSLQSYAVTEIASKIESLYFDGQKGAEMANLLLHNLERGKYLPFSGRIAFKEQLLQDMRSVHPDDHLQIGYTLKPLPGEMAPTPPAEEREEQREKELSFLRSIHFGIEAAEVDPSTQIGYLKINFFPDPDIPEAKEKMDAALLQVANAKELIIDLRDNVGGNPALVARVEGHFFEEKTLVSEIFIRSDNQTEQFFAEPVNGSFGASKPIYILVSEKTFSAGEALAYDLQAFKRAIIIGQRTVGSAHPTWPVHITPHLILGIPAMKVIHPITGTNWEESPQGKGVQPDIAISEALDALAVAHQEIAKNQR